MGCCKSCDDQDGHGCEGAKSPSMSLGESVHLPAVQLDAEAPTPAFFPGTVNVADRLGLGSQEVTASRPVSIEGSNAVRVDLFVVNLTLSSVAIRVQVSNDAVSWSDAAQFQRNSIGYATTKVRGIGFRFVRLFYEASNTASGEGVLAASLHHWKN